MPTCCKRAAATGAVIPSEPATSDGCPDAGRVRAGVVQPDAVVGERDAVLIQECGEPETAQARPQPGLCENLYPHIRRIVRRASPPSRARLAVLQLDFASSRNLIASSIFS